MYLVFFTKNLTTGCYYINTTRTILYYIRKFISANFILDVVSSLLEHIQVQDVLNVILCKLTLSIMIRL